MIKMWPEEIVSLFIYLHLFVCLFIHLFIYVELQFELHVARKKKKTYCY